MMRTVDAQTIARRDGDPPRVWALRPAYPNPFNPTLTIPYDVPAPGGRVDLRVYNVHGQLVNTLVSARVAPGRHRARWMGFDRRGQRVASGVYFVRMRAPGYARTRKVVLLR